MDAEKFYYIDHVTWNTFQLIRHVPSNEAVFTADIFFHFFKVFQKLLVNHVRILYFMIIFQLENIVKWLRILYYILHIITPLRIWVTLTILIILSLFLGLFDFFDKLVILVSYNVLLQQFGMLLVKIAHVLFQRHLPITDDRLLNFNMTSILFNFYFFFLQNLEVLKQIKSLAFGGLSVNLRVLLQKQAR
jgi:hypothetical protein